MQYLMMMIAGFLLVHLFKMIRLYLVLMEHKLPLRKFVLLYLRTTLVNVLIPFKLGEAYRIEEIWRLTGYWQVGVLSVVVDRYFDILALFLWLLAFGMMNGMFGGVIPAFGLLIVAGAFLYLGIPGSFSYLNRYLVMRRPSKRSMAALRALDLVKGWYDFTERLVSGRAFLIVATSALGWGAEIVTLKALADYTGISYRFSDFGAYIDSVFLHASDMPIAATYTRYSLIALAAVTIAGYLISGILWTFKDRDQA